MKRQRSREGRKKRECPDCDRRAHAYVLREIAAELDVPERAEGQPGKRDDAANGLAKRRRTRPKLGRGCVDRLHRDRLAHFRILLWQLRPGSEPRHDGYR